MSAAQLERDRDNREAGRDRLAPPQGWLLLDLKERSSECRRRTSSLGGAGPRSSRIAQVIFASTPPHGAL